MDSSRVGKRVASELRARQVIGAACAILLVLLAGAAHAAARPADAGAPYLRVLGGDGNAIERLPLESARVDAAIVGAIAEVTITQVFVNRGAHPIAARYVFPASAHAAVHGLTMTVGARTVRAVIGERVQQRQDYEAAKVEGRTAALLEQEDPTVFAMDLANVLPGDRIAVELRYSELIVPDAGVYELFVPNTFAPRYIAAGQAGIRTPSSAAPEVTDYSYDFQADLLSAVPLADIESPSHELVVQRDDAHHALARMAESERQGSRKDLRLRYRLAGDGIESGLLLAPGTQENFFALVLEPPRNMTAAQVVPREYIFVVDVSGSMMGAPLDIAKGLIDDLLAVLTPGDCFNLIMFSGDSQVLSTKGSLAAGPDTAARARAFLDSTRGNGGTELLPALDKAYSLPRTPGMARSIVVVTDGGIGYGGSEFRKVREHVGEANVFAFGIGTMVNRDVIENLARAGHGEPFLTSDLAEGKALAGRLRHYIDRPAFSGIRIGLDGFDAYDLQPAQVPDLLAERPLVIVGRYRGKPQGRIVVEGWAGRERQVLRIDAAAGVVDRRGTALPHLWARQRIQEIGDAAIRAVLDDAGKAEVTALGLRYSLLTPYTSFLAVTEERRTAEAAIEVEQPAPERMASDPAGAGVAGPLERIEVTGSRVRRVDVESSQPTFVVGRGRGNLGGYGSPASLGARLTLEVLANVGAVTSSSAVERDDVAATGIAAVVAGVRPDIVFLLGSDAAAGGYFDAAQAYWRQALPLATLHLEARNLADVRAVLAATTHGPWGRIVLVAHGSEWSGLTVNLSAASDSARLGVLRHALDAGTFPPLPDSVVDAGTRIELESCGLGRRAEYLDAIGRLFGGDDAQRPRVSAAEGLVWYATQGAGAGMPQLPTRQELSYVGIVADGSATAAGAARRRASAIWQRTYGSVAPAELIAVPLPIEIVVVAGSLSIPDRRALRRVLQSTAMVAEFAGSGLDPARLRWHLEGAAGDERWRGQGTAYLFTEPLPTGNGLARDSSARPTMAVITENRIEQTQQDTDLDARRGARSAPH